MRSYARQQLPRARERGAHHRPAEALLGERPRFLVELERVDMAEFAKHGEVVASAAADFENARVRRRPD